MKVTITYVGNPDARDSAKPSVTVRGVVFPLNVAVPLDAASDAGKAFVAKLRGNREFLVEDAGEGKKAGDKKKVDG
jgi:hypothetical protein